ncbi:competence protein CoiA [Flavilitoribacter nigricans]|uniref:Competence protein CoiA-like N-terminal domain-containing protein n=1 Tax=Flavilitoribacter nigricans (strain ATCC 23147 / DSM 23189 / NBRC 102662 / NCIMB 1420 / SS-2) TaxID=1122177 RepID=A0A2D0MYD0_FLAN2|nr:competence protein CoiA family protein [Flavilitoribacter nigricans]PHN01138.1 hypothetical protein CRP01_38695 [Flavilitoribacter nigricans DSM 23189 = NBRC 102662]
MKYAKVNGKKVEAKPKLRGICTNCSQEMVAKCGRVKIWHWAHKSRLHCDPWWESETEWHRNWKNNFPVEWQEISHKDKASNERHIADVKTSHGLVLEFQHSLISPAEVESREQFYGNLIWIVDGNRSELDKGHFNLGLSGPIQKDPLAYQISWYGRSRLLQNWAESKVMVYLDFGDEILWRLVLYNSQKKTGAVGPLSKKAFIEDCLNGYPIRVSKLEE